MRHLRLYLRSLALGCLFALAAGSVLAGAAAAQGASGKWSYFQFKPGQYLKYDMKSARGIQGWLSLKVDDGGKGVLNVTVAGKWTKDFSETAKLKPGQSAFDLAYAFKDIEITNAASSLLDVDSAVVENTVWKDGFTWAKGDQSILVKGEKECAGVKGLLAVYSSKSFGRVQKKTFGVNTGLPLPIFVEVPAANDTWTYTLVEKKGF